MRTPTLRSIPPLPPAMPSRPRDATTRRLVGPVRVVCAGIERELRHGSILLGRELECDLMIEDPLVSRMHARLQVHAAGVCIEDLYSTNGVYLNGERILQTRFIHVGDRVFIGSHELTLIEARTDPASAPSTPPRSVRFPEPQEPPTYKTPTAEGAPGPVPITARADALDLLGSMARKLANDVKAEQAPRLLGPHLEGILRGASAGLVVPEALGEVASEYAIDLAHWTGEARWLNYVVELHLATKRLMSPATVSALQRSERWVAPLDRALLEYYIGSIDSRSAALDRAERARLATLRRILKKR